jgi:hypothetical protein
MWSPFSANRARSAPEGDGLRPPVDSPGWWSAGPAGGHHPVSVSENDWETTVAFFPLPKVAVIDNG